jgi:hypothetical protein
LGNFGLFCVFGCLAMLVLLCLDIFFLKVFGFLILIFFSGSFTVWIFGTVVLLFFLRLGSFNACALPIKYHLPILSEVCSPAGWISIQETGRHSVE